MSVISMNYKLEKFWNFNLKYSDKILIIWTINLKSFEIFLNWIYYLFSKSWTINLKSFEIFYKLSYFLFNFLWTINLKSFEILP